jgi:hypothetical protein
MDMLTVLLAANAGLLVANGMMFLAGVRAIRRLIVLDRLLVRICVDAFTRSQQPVWRAWTAAMGSLRVSVHSERRNWDDVEGE